MSRRNETGGAGFIGFVRILCFLKLMVVFFLVMVSGHFGLSLLLSVFSFFFPLFCLIFARFGSIVSELFGF